MAGVLSGVAAGFGEHGPKESNIQIPYNSNQGRKIA
jgi:hypothetical protein